MQLRDFVSTDNFFYEKFPVLKVYSEEEEDKRTPNFQVRSEL